MNINQKVVILLQIFLFSACSLYSSEYQKDKETKFSLTPKTLTGESVLRISLPKQRPANLSIKSPEGNWYVVHSQEEKIYIVSNEKFSMDRHIDIPIFSTKGLIWNNGKKNKELVFNKSGEYTIYIADNLETEPENTFHFIGKVHFNRN